MFKLFGEKYAEQEPLDASVKEANQQAYDLPMVAEDSPEYETPGESSNKEPQPKRPKSAKNEVKSAVLIPARHRHQGRA